ARGLAQNLFTPSNGPGFVESALAALHQSVPDLGEELDLARGWWFARRILLLLAAKLVHGLDRHEQHEGDDQEADHIVDEQTDIHGRGAGLRGWGERSVVLAVQRDEDAAEVASAGDHADRRHDDIVDQRSYDGGEGGADNDADRHVHHVAAERKFLELFQNRHRLQAPFSSGPQLAMFGRQSKSGRWSG